MKKIIFLDRDGVINKENTSEFGYVTKPSEFLFLPRVKKAVKQLKDKGYRVIVISNQAGIAKGLYSKTALNKITAKMKKGIASSGGKIDQVYYCLHQDSDNCACRKPKAGLFHKAAKKRKIDFKNTYFIGDTERDIIAGNEVGLKNITVLSGKNKQKNIKKWKTKPDYIAKDLYEAVTKIVLTPHSRAGNAGYHTRKCADLGRLQ